MKLSELHFVQVALSHDPYGREGWQTVWVSPDRAAAEQMSESQERAQRFAEGENFTEHTVAVARVVTADSLLNEDGIDALIAALAGTRVQIQRLLDRA